VQRIDYDFSRLRIRRRDQKTTAIRAKAYDWWVQRFLDTCPGGTVLNLGCGLDTRVYRVNPPSTVRWYDIDLAGIIELRRRLFAPRAGLRTIAASVTDPQLLDAIPSDTPVFVVAEGLTPYLRATDGVVMLRRITEHFPSGEMVFDGYSRLGVWITQRYGPVKASGAQLDWAIDDPHELEAAISGLVFDSEWLLGDVPNVNDYYSWPTRKLFQILFRITALRRLGRRLHYHFDRSDPRLKKSP
jgi:O-methyltransferase involved in polyketide biosynthesis